MVCRRLGLDPRTPLQLCAVDATPRGDPPSVSVCLVFLKPLPPRASVQLRGIRASGGNSDRCVRVARTNRADLTPGEVNICFCATPGPDGPARSFTLLAHD